MARAEGRTRDESYCGLRMLVAWKGRRRVMHDFGGTSDPGMWGAGLTVEERSRLLDLARAAVRAAACNAELPALDAEEVSPGLAKPRACFVTLRISEQLRGCMGQLVAMEPVWEAVVKNAGRAATQDYRFARLTPGEADVVGVEVSVLSSAVDLQFQTPADLLSQLVPGRHGVILRIGGVASTFLPQVWGELPSKEAFMEHLARKGGHSPGAWRGRGVAVAVYEVESIEQL